MTTLSDFRATTLDGQEQDLDEYAGDVVLVVNTASKCGYTPQFEGLQDLYDTYADRGFTVLGFPSNQFKQELDGAEEISGFCQQNYGVSFPMFAKVDVNGKTADPLYKWLKKQQSGLLGGRINWNFTKFLVARDGTVLNRYAPTKEPAELAEDIEGALGAPGAPAAPGAAAEG